MDRDCHIVTATMSNILVFRYNMIYLLSLSTIDPHFYMGAATRPLYPDIVVSIELVT